jgi:hypothetical protein
MMRASDRLVLGGVLAYYAGVAIAHVINFVYQRSIRV